MAYDYGSRNHNQIRVKQSDQPLDTVKSIIWNPYLNIPSFITAGWDGFVRLYQIVNNQAQKNWDIFLQHPILAIDVNQNNIVFAGLASGHIVAVDMANSNIIILGIHDAPICSVYWIKEKGCLMTFGFDKLIKFWALSEPFLQTQFMLPLKTIVTSLDFPYLLIGSKQSTVFIMSLKNLPNINLPKSPDEYSSVSLQFFSTLNACKILASTKKGIIGTADGRTAYFGFREDSYGKLTPIDSQITRNQKKSEGKQLHGQVNSVQLGCHQYETFCVIGGSQSTTAFNLNKRQKRLTAAIQSSTTGSGTAVKLSPKLDYLIFATGSDWIKGIHELQNMRKPKIGVLKLQSSDLRQLITKP